MHLALLWDLLLRVIAPVCGLKYPLLSMIAAAAAVSSVHHDVLDAGVHHIP